VKPSEWPDPARIETKEEGLVMFSPRQRFLAALLVYLSWVAVLAGLAVTSSTRPATRMAPPEVKSAPNAPPSARSL
jgi:hypothetical protein